MEIYISKLWMIYTIFIIYNSSNSSNMNIDKYVLWYIIHIYY